MRNYCTGTNYLVYFGRVTRDRVESCFNEYRRAGVVDHIFYNQFLAYYLMKKASDGTFVDSSGEPWTRRSKLEVSTVPGSRFICLGVYQNGTCRSNIWSISRRLPL